MDSTELHRATVYRFLIRTGQELQLSVKMGIFSFGASTLRRYVL
jgi:hypothetical protein